MFWLVAMGCAGRVQDDSGEAFNGFVKLFVGYDIQNEAYCAVRVDGSTECFGKEESIGGVPSDQKFSQVLPTCQCGLDLDGEVFCWKDDWGLMGELPPGPYSRIECASDGRPDGWALGIREVDGAVELVESFEGAMLGPLDNSSAIRDFAGTSSMHEGCLIDTDGQISCWPEDEVRDYWLPIPEGDFEKLYPTGVSAFCATDASDRASCFGKFFYDFDLEMVEALPSVRKIEWQFALTGENELITTMPDFNMGEGLVVDGGLYWDISQTSHECALPVEDPDAVHCNRMDERPMDILPPGWE